MEWYERELPVGYEVIWAGLTKPYKDKWLLAPDRKTFELTMLLIDELFKKEET